MSGKIEPYFACANTGKGFVNLFASNLEGLRKIFILKGGPGTGKSTLMKKIGKNYIDKGYTVEYISCSSDVDSLDGVIIRKIGVAIVDGTAPHVIEPNAPGAVEEYVNLGDAWDVRLLSHNTREIMALQNKIKGCYAKVYEVFATALKIHDEWEKIYINEMDFHKMNELTAEVISNLLEDFSFDKESVVRERFFGGATYKGTIDYVKELTEGISARYFIKGRPGTGKSTMLKKLIKEAKNRGMDILVYHCGFDPDSLDMVILPELDLCIFDSTAPHEYFPYQEGDSIIDVYECVITPGTDEKYAEGLQDIKDRYKLYVAEGISYLKRAKEYHDTLENYYVQATSFSIIDEKTDALLSRIMEYEHKNSVSCPEG